MVAGPINFEGLVPDRGSDVIPDGYSGLNWDSFGVVDVDAVLGTKDGFHKVLTSGEAVGFTIDAQPSFISSPDASDDFDFDHGYFAAAWSKDLKVTVIGYDDDEKVAKKVFYLDPKQTVVQFSHDFDSVDTVKIVTKGGTDANPSDGGEGRNIALDDLFIGF